MIPTTDAISDLAHLASTTLEFVAILAILFALAIAFARAIKWFAKRDPAKGYSAFKQTFGRGLLLGLEILVAADLLWTVAVDPTWENLAALGVLVVIRTFLSWSLEVELEGHWPWQRYRIEEANRCPDDE